VRFYVGLTGALKLQSTTGAGVNSATYQSITTGGAAPPGSNNFPAATPAKLKFGSGFISGDGTTSGIFTPTEIGNAVNLDTLVTPGSYVQSSDAEAAAGTNYPPLAPYAGTLEVSGLFGGVKMQRYSAYRNSDVTPSPNIWERVFDGSTWGAWVPIHYDTGWITTISSVVVAATGWTVASAAARQLNLMAYVKCVFTRTGAAIPVADSASSTGNTDCGTLVARWRLTGQTQALFQGSDRLAAFTVNSSGLINLFANAPSFNIAVGDQVSAFGSYFI
jgi:hypothetical protein